MGILGRLMGTAEGATTKGVRGARAKRGTTGRNVGGRSAGKTKLRGTPSTGRRMGRRRATPPPRRGIGGMVDGLLRRR
jgi:hypothetical protein